MLPARPSAPAARPGLWLTPSHSVKEGIVAAIANFAGISRSQWAQIAEIPTGDTTGTIRAILTEYSITGLLICRV
jgi:hypothetical protein